MIGSCDGHDDDDDDDEEDNKKKNEVSLHFATGCQIRSTNLILK